jgi:uncharacterized protein YggE
MTEAPVVAVRGEATLEVDAEIAEFTATVELRDRNRVTALNRVAERVAALRAVALGADIVGLVELSDAGLSRGPEPRTAMRSMAAGLTGPPHLDLDPQRQQIHASIEARFTISQPTVLAAPLD